MPESYLQQFNYQLPADMEDGLKDRWKRYFLRRDANLGGLLVLLIFAFQNVIGTVYSLLTDGLFDNGQNAALSQMLDGLVYLLYMAVPAVIIWLIARSRGRDCLIEYPRGRVFSPLPFLLIAVGTVPLFQYVSYGIDWVLSLIKMDTYAPLLDAAFAPVTDPEALVIQFITTAVLAALFEEFAFRGLLLNLLRRYGDGFAIVCSGVLFGVLHGNTAQIPFAVLFGLVAGALVVYTGSIWSAVGLHFLNNFTAMTLDTLYSRIDENVAQAIEWGVWGTMFAIGLVGVALLVVMRRRVGNYKLPARPYQMQPTRRMYGAFFSAPTVVAALVLLLLQAFYLTTFVQEAVNNLLSQFGLAMTY